MSVFTKKNNNLYPLGGAYIKKGNSLQLLQSSDRMIYYKYSDNRFMPLGDNKIMVDSLPCIIAAVGESVHFWLSAGSSHSGNQPVLNYDKKAIGVINGSNEISLEVTNLPSGFTFNNEHGNVIEGTVSAVSQGVISVVASSPYLPSVEFEVNYNFIEKPIITTVAPIELDIALSETITPFSLSATVSDGNEPEFNTVWTAAGIECLGGVVSGTVTEVSSILAVIEVSSPHAETKYIVVYNISSDIEENLTDFPVSINILSPIEKTLMLKFSDSESNSFTYLALDNSWTFSGSYTAYGTYEWNLWDNGYKRWYTYLGTGSASSIDNILGTNAWERESGIGFDENSYSNIAISTGTLETICISGPVNIELYRTSPTGTEWATFSNDWKLYYHTAVWWLVQPNNVHGDRYVFLSESSDIDNIVGTHTWEHAFNDVETGQSFQITITKNSVIS